MKLNAKKWIMIFFVFVITVLAIMGMSRWMLSYMIGFATKLLGSLDSFAGL